jgi:hypothetical protein
MANRAQELDLAPDLHPLLSCLRAARPTQLEERVVQELRPPPFSVFERAHGKPRGGERCSELRLLILNHHTRAGGAAGGSVVVACLEGVPDFVGSGAIVKTSGEEPTAGDDYYPSAGNSWADLAIHAVDQRACTADLAQPARCEDIVLHRVHVVPHEGAFHDRSPIAGVVVRTTSAPTKCFWNGAITPL